MKNDGLILALRRLMPCQDIEIISDVIPTINEGDVILLRKHADSLSGAYARLQDVPDVVLPAHGDRENEAADNDGNRDEDEREEEIETIIAGSEAFSACRFSTNAFALNWARVQNAPHIAVVTETDRATRRINIMFASLSTAIRKGLSLDVVLTDKAIGSGSFKEVSQRLLGWYSFPVGNKRYLIVAHHMFAHESSFLLLNGQTSLSVTEEYRSECGGVPDEHGTEKVWAAKSGSRPYHRDDDYRIEIWESRLNFCDATSASLLTESARTILRDGNEKYINLWKRYAEIDFAYVTECREKAGVLRFTKILDNTADRAVLLIDNYNQIPGFRSMLEEIDKEGLVVDIMQDESSKWSKHASVTAFRDREIVVAFDDEKPLDISSGIVTINTYSAETQFKRRQEAYNTILAMKSAKQGLLSLLNGVIPHMETEKRRMTPLSQSVIKKVFPDHDPTPNQIEAIRIALNTPDIAIIQGPPGTGKTTVIRAIYEALSEKEKNPKLFFGRNLATAYQRDATEHLASEMDVYGLPAMTFLGRRKGGWEEGNKSVRLWLEKTKQKVYEANPVLEGYAILDRLANNLDLLRLSFDPDTAIDEKRSAAVQSFLYEIECFENIRDSTETPSDPDEMKVRDTCEAVDLEPFKQRARDMLASIQRSVSHEHDVDICYAVMLPTSEAAMEDNGHQIIREVVQRLSGERQKKEIRETVLALEKLYAQEPVRYDRVRDGINALLSRLRYRSDLVVNRTANKEFLDLIQDTIDVIQDAVGDDEMYLLSHYVNSFDDMDTMRESLSRFLTVIAATNQMVASKEVIDRKKPSGIAEGKRDEKPDAASGPAVDEEIKEYDVYDNIIIDEAARSCPPDLLIPMSRAKDRIVLVGDHKQLPQFISENVYKRLNAEKQDTDLVKKSMFQYLITQVEALKSTGDGIHRYIMLDQQFRMPAIVGDLVSRHFYPEHPLLSPLGNGGKKLPVGLSFVMGNGRKNDRIGRSHLVWLNVAGHSGTREAKDLSKSTYREEEVRRVSGMIRALVSSAEGDAKDYTYGVITFYKAQEIRLKKAVPEALLSGENPACNEEWYKKHVEIGTVDAFQGKEFDIVFLSMVRCNTDYGSFHYGLEEKGRHRYGHTMDENRLCVALSRVKKCLIVAGDEKMFSDDDARQIMPAIYDLLSICKTADEGRESYAWYIPDNSGKKDA